MGCLASTAASETTDYNKDIHARCFPFADINATKDSNNLEFPDEHGVPTLGTVWGEGHKMVFTKTLPETAGDLTELAIKLKSLGLVVSEWVPEDVRQR